MRADNVKGRVAWALLEAKPDMTYHELARETPCSMAYANLVFRKFHAARRNNGSERVWCRHGIDMLGEPCKVCLEEGNQLQEPDASPEQLDEVLQAASIMSATNVDSILDERGTRYGTFLQQAIITQRLKAVMGDTPNWIALNDDMTEALEMIAIKIGRILNGDPSYVDSWVDIAGYAQLVADRLEGKVR